MKTFSNQTIRMKLVIIITLTSIIAVVTGLGIYLIFDSVSNKKEMKKNAMLNATLVAQYSIVPLVFDYKEEANNVLAKLSTIPSVTDACLYSANSEDIYAVYHKSPDSQYKFPPLRNESVEFKKGYMHVFRTITENNKYCGTIYLRISAGLMHEKLIYSLMVMGGLVLILLASVFFIASHLQKLISNPILRLTESIASVSQSQDFTIQLQPQGDDEVGTLYQQFNKMLSQLLKSQTDRDMAEKEITFLAHAFKSINENVTITDIDDNIIFVNHSLLATYGYSKDELIGKNINILRSSRNPQELIRKIQPSTLKGGWQGELLNKRKDGSEFPISLRTTIIFDKANQPTALVGVSSDITKRKKEEHELMLHRDHLEELVKQRTLELEIEKENAQSADRLKSAFLATMSHELRTPLNSIIGFSGILMQERPGPLNPEQKKQLGMVQTSARHLLSLINDVLDISKIEAGQLKINLGLFNIPEVIFKAVETNKTMAEKKNIPINVFISQDVNEIMSDKLRVQQILINLVNNAVKFTEVGAVGIECHKNSDFIIIKVKDSGIGIEKEQIERLFKPFTQVDTGLTRKHEGTGLGLSICKKLLDMLKGTIEIESEFGSGSVFTVKLPINKI